MNAPSPQVKAPSRSVVELIEAAELGAHAAALRRDDPREFVAALVEQEHYADAVRFLAHALPRNYAVWWAWLCAGGSVVDQARSAPAQAALDVVWRWLEAPSDENRRAAFVAAEAAEVGTPAGCAAFAAFLSGGSIAPPEVPPVEPEEFAAAKAVGGSIILSAVMHEPEHAPHKFRTFLAHGLEVANRIRLWSTV